MKRRKSMKLTKRLLCLLLTLCLTAGLLSGCGKKQSAAQVELHPYTVTDVDTKFDELASPR